MAKILIAEDEKALASSLFLKLSNVGHQVEVVADGQAAVAQLSSAKYDLLLLDLVMPKMNGFEVLEQMKQRRISVKTVVLTNLAQDEDVKKAAEYGVAEYWVKTDTSLSDIVSRVGKLLGG